MSSKRHVQECSWDLFILAKTGNNCPLVVEWRNKLGHCHPMECYTAMKNALLLHGTTWTNFTRMLLNKRNYIHTHTFWIMLFIWGSKSKSSLLFYLKCGKNDGGTEFYSVVFKSYPGNCNVQPELRPTAIVTHPGAFIQTHGFSFQHTLQFITLA